MCNNSLIYVITNTSSAIQTNEVLPLTTIVRRRSSAISQVSDSIVLDKAGYYRVSVNATFVASTAGVATIEVRQDGLQVQGATASTSITTATTQNASISFDTIVRVRCCQGTSILTFVNSGVPITASNIAINVEYLD